MAGNEWINGYLEAILDAGAALEENRRSVRVPFTANFKTTKYFVEQVVSGFDESDLHRTWIKVMFNNSFLISLEFTCRLIPSPHLTVVMLSDNLGSVCARQMCTV
eukprot:Gb_17918 [translate_table: standard]